MFHFGQRDHIVTDNTGSPDVLTLGTLKNDRWPQGQRFAPGEGVSLGQQAAAPATTDVRALDKIAGQHGSPPSCEKERDDELGDLANAFDRILTSLNRRNEVKKIVQWHNNTREID